MLADNMWRDPDRDTSVTGRPDGRRVLVESGVRVRAWVRAVRINESPTPARRARAPGVRVAV